MALIRRLISSANGIDTYQNYDRDSGEPVGSTYTESTPRADVRQAQLREAYQRLAAIKTDADALQTTTFANNAQRDNAIKQIGAAVGDVAFLLSKLAELTLGD